MRHFALLYRFFRVSQELTNVWLKEPEMNLYSAIPGRSKWKSRITD